MRSRQDDIGWLSEMRGGIFPRAKTGMDRSLKNLRIRRFLLELASRETGLHGSDVRRYFGRLAPGIRERIDRLCERGFLEKRKLGEELCGRGCSGPCARCPAYFLTGDGRMLLEITREKERELMLRSLPPRRVVIDPERMGDEEIGRVVNMLQEILRRRRSRRKHRGTATVWA